MNKLPMGWVEVGFAELNNYKSKTVNPTNFASETFELYSVPVFPDKEPEIILGSDIGSSKIEVQTDDVLICKINPRINRVWTVGDFSSHKKIASSEWVVFRSNLVNPTFYCYYFQSSEFREKLCADVTGVGGSLTRAQPKNIAKFKLPLPSLFEQDHIATLLDNHLSQVATISQKLNDILPIIKQFRQSVLAQAVSGKLTEGWRESNSENSKIVEFGKEKVKEPLFNIAKNTLPDLPSSWDIYPLGKLSNYVTSGSRGWADYYSDNGAIFFRMSNVRYDTTKLDLNDLQFVNLPDNVEGKRSLIEKDDLIISITADVGRVARIDKDYGEAYINQHLALVRPIKEINAEFLAKCICSQNVGILQVNALKRGATKAGLGLDDIRSLAIPVPPLPEQQQIVTEVERLFAVADSIETQVKEALERVGHLTQSILHQAFTGNLSADWRACNADLITGEHSATALLAQIKQAEPKSPRKKKAQ